MFAQDISTVLGYISSTDSENGLIFAELALVFEIYPLLLLLLVGSGAKEEQQGVNLSGTLCRPSIRPITIFHRFSFIQISLLAIFSKPSGVLQILSQ